jgi:hypothetical protein
MALCELPLRCPIPCEMERQCDGEGANVSISSRNKHKQQPKCSTTARVTQFRWPTKKSRAFGPFCAKLTSCRRNSTKCVALARLSRASSRGSIAWTAAYRLDAPLPATRITYTIATPTHTAFSLHNLQSDHGTDIPRSSRTHHTLQERKPHGRKIRWLTWADWKPRGCWRSDMFCTGPFVGIPKSLFLITFLFSSVARFYHQYFTSWYTIFPALRSSNKIAASIYTHRASLY